MFKTPNLESIEKLHLTEHEIFSTEPIHGITGHMKNILEEFGHHVEPSEKKIFDNTVEISLGGKATKRAFDYRETIIDV